MDHGLSSAVHRPNGLLQHLIDAELSDDVIRDQMLTMLIAGPDTSTALLAHVSQERFARSGSRCGRGKSVGRWIPS